MTTKTLIEKVTDWTKRLAGAQTALEELGATERALRDERDRLLAERSHLIGSLPPRAEVLADTARAVDRAGAEWRAQHGMDLVRAAAGRVNVSVPGAVEGTSPGNVLADFPYPLDAPALCALLPEAAKAGLAAIVNAATWDAGPSLAERPALIASIDAKVRAVEAEHTALVDRAAELGIRLDLLPEESARRIQAAQRREYVAKTNALNADAIRRGTMEPLR